MEKISPNDLLVEKTYYITYFGSEYIVQITNRSLYGSFHKQYKAIAVDIKNKFYFNKKSIFATSITSVKETTLEQHVHLELCKQKSEYVQPRKNNNYINNSNFYPIF